MPLRTDRLRGYAHGVRDKRVPDDHPDRCVLPIGFDTKRAVTDLHRAAKEIDRLREGLQGIANADDPWPYVYREMARDVLDPNRP